MENKWLVAAIALLAVSVSFAVQCETYLDCDYGYECINGTCEKPMPDGRGTDSTCCGSAFVLLGSIGLVGAGKLRSQHI